MPARLKTWGIALLIGIAVGLFGDIAILNYNCISTTGCEEVTPSEVVLPQDQTLPSVGEDASTEYAFDDVTLNTLSISLPAGRTNPKKSVTVTVYAIDEGSSVYYEIGELYIKGSETAYAKLHLTGAAKKIKLASDATKATEVEVKFNAPIPFEAHPMFIAGCAGIVLLICLFRPGALVYRKRFDESRRFIAVLTAAILVVSCVSTGYMANKFQVGAQEHQYFELAEALADGHVCLDEEPSEALLSLDNPYDFNARKAAKVREDSGGYAFWDHALYKGKYYVYFGVLPCLVFFLPYYLATGAELPLAVAIIITMAILCLGLVRLSFSCCRRWSPGCSQATLLYSAFTFATGSWIVYAAIKPGHYALPILLGLALLAWGIDLCIEATARREISLPRAAAGAGLIAATVACRPQLLIGGLIAICLLVKHMRDFGIRSDLKALGVALAPCVVVFALQGWYNFIRFDSVFDFGANYNLTTNDMTKRGFNVDRIPLALLSYLFQPPVFGASSPFLRAVDLNADYFGVSIVEKMFGGIFCLTPLLFPIFLPILGRYRRILGKGRTALVGLSALCAIALVIFDANAAGILPRYFMDFGFFLAFGSALCIIAIWGRRNLKAFGEGDATGADIAQHERYVYYANGKAHLSLAGISLLFCAVFTGFVMVLNAAKIGM